MCNSGNFVVHVVLVNQCGTVHTHMWPASSFVWCSSSFLPLPLHSLCLAFVSGKLAGGWFMLCVCCAPWGVSRTVVKLNIQLMERSHCLAAAVYRRYDCMVSSSNSAWDVGNTCVVTAPHSHLFYKTTYPIRCMNVKCLLSSILFYETALLIAPSSLHRFWLGCNVSNRTIICYMPILLQIYLMDTI